MDDAGGTPELDGYEPIGRPLRSTRRARVLRAGVVLGLVGLVLPGVLITASTAARTAERACALYTAALVPGATDSWVAFELVGPEGPGWSCYAARFGEDALLVRALGLIPGPAVLPRERIQQSAGFPG